MRTGTRTNLRRAYKAVRSKACTRFREVLVSIYLFNEHRGYTRLDALEAALRAHRPDARELADAVKRHAADERRHYRMFRAWFRKHGRMPYRVDARTGYIDRLLRAVDKGPLEHVNLDAVVIDDAQLCALCRLVVLTEERGLAQVHALLGFAPVFRDRTLRKIFEQIARDEPSHFEPYLAWLVHVGASPPGGRERAAELRTHFTILGLELPRLLFDPRLPRLETFPA